MAIQQLLLQQIKSKGSVVELSLVHYLILGAILFAISIVGIFLNRKNIIILLSLIHI